VSIQFAAAELEATIAAVLAEFPELADDEDTRRDTLEGCTGLDDVMARLARLIREEDAVQVAMSVLAKRYRERGERAEQREKAYRELARRIMERADLTRYRTPEAAFSITPGKPVAEIVDAEAIPDAFVRVKREPAKAMIRDALAAGTDVPGARLTNGAPVLRIV